MLCYLGKSSPRNDFKFVDQSSVLLTKPHKALGGILARYDDDDDDQKVMTLDDLLGPVPESEANKASDYYDLDELSQVMGNSVSDKNLSKSQRVRNFLDENPEARNRDVVEALGEYGITAADVSNAKAQLKRKGETPSKRGKTAAPAAVASTVSKTAAAAAVSASGGSIAMGELEAAITFVRQIGSIDRARQLLVIIQQVQQL